jgi:septal ring factor EnvC (AmiA/AmiB activator)
LYIFLKHAVFDMVSFKGRVFAMANLKKCARFLLIGSCIAMAGVCGCTKKPSQDELTKLDEAKQSAESAEKKLTELKQERMQLEATLQSKQTELKQNEDERDDLKKKTGK